MRAAIKNPAGIGRVGWVQCAFPLHAPQGPWTFVCDDGRRFPAWAFHRSGAVSTQCWIQAALQPNELVIGSLESGSDPLPPFALHPWVKDDPAALLPDPELVIDGRVYGGSKIVVVETLATSPAHELWHVQRHFPSQGFVFEWYAFAKANDPVLDIFGVCVWSTRKDPALLKNIAGVALRTGEMLYLDFASHLGMVPAQWDGERWTVGLVVNPRFQDAAGFPFSGQLACFLGPTLAALSLPGAIDPIAFDSIKAASKGPMVALCTDWPADSWLGERLPRFAEPGAARTIAKMEQLAFDDLLSRAGSYGEPRPLGCAPDPSNTGDQEDFSYTKGASSIVAGNPSWIMQARFSVYAEFLRGGMHFEDAIGPVLHPLKNDEHESWVTWSGVTHFSHAVSPDRLGKKDEVFGERASATSFVMGDEEHVSKQTMHAYRALFFDPLIEQLDAHRSVVDYAEQRGRVGAARAWGRQLQHWTQSVLLADSSMVAARYLALISDKALAADVSQYMNAPGPFKVLNIQSPDPRKGILDPSGHPASSACGFEHGLAAVGALHTYLRSGLPADTKNLLTICTTLAEYFCWLDPEDGGWWAVDDAYYAGNGVPPTPAMYARGSAQIKSTRGGTGLWTAVGLLIAAEWLPAGNARDRAQAFVAWWTGNHEASDRRLAEWYAAVRAIPVVPVTP